MEYVLLKKALSVCEAVFEGSSEQPVDIDFTLPDYCPDIEKILKCTATPYISMKNLSGGNLEIDGVVNIKVLYLDSKNKTIRCCEHTSPFSCSFTIKGDSENAVASVSIKTEYVNCRALTPRRLDIHGAFTVSARVLKESQQEIPEAVQGDDVEQKSSTVPISSLVGISSGIININETLDIGKNRPAPQTIIRTELTVSHSEPKLAAEKLIVKGEAVLKILYVTDLETGELDTAEFSIPINEMLDASGISDSDTCDMELTVQSYEAGLKSDFDDDSTLISFEAKLCVMATVYNEDTVKIIDDAYSRAYELDLTYKQISCRHIATVIDDEISEKNDINLDSTISRIIDIYGDSPQCSCEFQQAEGKLMIKCKLTCCILGCDENDAVFYTEKPIEFSREYDIGKVTNPSSKPIVAPLSISYRISGENSLEVRAGISLHMAVSESISKRIVNEITADEEQKRERDKTAALTIYYADAGENLWSIARNYCTSVEAIKMQNDLADDVISASGMILIPM